MKTFLDLTADIIDIRDIIERIEELETQEVFNDAHKEELRHLYAIIEDLKGNGGDEQWRGDWYPVTLIADGYFTEYAQELVSDIGDLPRDIPTYIEIDWEATARNIRMDYTSVEVDGFTYYYR